eukprot:2449783-Prymnesium_polylepis.2
MLINDQVLFLRLLSALAITIAYLVAMLACRPYKRAFEYCMAAGCQLLFVCTFIGGIIVHLYERIANDSAGSPYLAQRFLGLNSSEEGVIFMIGVALCMLGVLGSTLFAEAYFMYMQRRLEAKWSVW